MSRHLMAKFRKSAAPQMDWREVPDKHFDKIQAYVAPLENGHHLVVWGMKPGSTANSVFNFTNFDGVKDGWMAHVDTTSPPPNPDFDTVGHGISGSKSVKPEVPYEGYRPHHFPTPEHAMEAVEKAYSQMFPLGTNTGGHDSGVDYSDLNKFMGEL